ncbi:MAG: amino acid ABC transporter permease [Anaerolineae bacterium]|nr:MAG: amino acid ABC transporter permease [Anaerolineae bacterium]
MTTVTQQREILPPPSERSTALGWVLKNLLNTWYNGLLTLVVLGIVFVVLRGTIHWALTDARWEVIPANLRLFLVGQYPSQIPGEADQVWRIWLDLYLLAATVGLSWGVWVQRKEIVSWVLAGFPILIALIPFSLKVRALLVGLTLTGLVFWWIGKRWKERLQRLTIILWLAYFPVAVLFINGFGSEEAGFLPVVPTRFWGGLLLSILLAIVGIVFSFPIGVLLALGRQSELPVLRTLSVLYIELIRGVPLISLLFMGQVMLPLFMPQGINPDRVIRAMVAITMFAAAYLAENVRGGLQAISKGQYEAAYALGLNGFQTMTYIVLPQALRTVIPVLVGQFIALFKDTSLVAIVGLLDLLGIAEGVIANPKFIGTQREVLLFISVFYFVLSYALSYASRRLEVALGVGQR